MSRAEYKKAKEFLQSKNLSDSSIEKKLSTLTENQIKTLNDFFLCDLIFQHKVINARAKRDEQRTLLDIVIGYITKNEQRLWDDFKCKYDTLNPVAKRLVWVLASPPLAQRISQESHDMRILEFIFQKFNGRTAEECEVIRDKLAWSSSSFFQMQPTVLLQHVRSAPNLSVFFDGKRVIYEGAYTQPLCASLRRSGR